MALLLVTCLPWKGCYGNPSLWAPAKFKDWQLWPLCSLVQLCLFPHGLHCTPAHKWATACLIASKLLTFICAPWRSFSFGFLNISSILHFFCPLYLSFPIMPGLEMKDLKKERTVNKTHRWSRWIKTHEKGGWRPSKEILKIKHTAKTLKLSL